MTARSFRRPRRATVAVFPLVLVAAGCAASAGEAQDPRPADGAEPSRAATLADGAYSADQAARGAELFGQVCGDCHATREFRGTDFFFAWEGSTVGRFVQVVAETMPEDDPGGLPMDQYLAVAAYVLELNEYPAGASPLPDDPAYLAGLRITRPTAPPPADSPAIAREPRP